MNKPSHTFDEKLWNRVLTGKQIQGFAGKIEIVLQVKGEGRELVKALVEKWAELTNVRHHFPDLEDVFTPEAIFRIEYAHRIKEQGSHSRYDSNAWVVRDVLTYISNLVAKQRTEIEQLKHLYNNRVSAISWYKGEIALPLIEDSFKDGRNTYPLFIPLGAPDTKKKKKSRAGTKTARLIENHLTALDPKFSIGPDGQLRITM
jgi:hypothetical protein